MRDVLCVFGYLANRVIISSESQLSGEGLGGGVGEDESSAYSKQKQFSYHLFI